jgi:organic radical activating enzyme
MAYTVKEIFYTLQGEGANAGRPAVFCRFSGCNLWTGRERDRATAVCTFCDTDFVGVGPLVVCTGGEPLLQLDAPLVEALHAAGFEVAVETNGTQLPPPGVDHLCVSPKAGAPLRLTHGDELKLVYPQREPEAQPERFEGLAFDRFYLQPMDGPDAAANMRLAVEYCLAHPRWRLSVQTHKVLGIR